MKVESSGLGWLVCSTDLRKIKVKTGRQVKKLVDLISPCKDEGLAKCGPCLLAPSLTVLVAMIWANGDKESAKSSFAFSISGFSYSLFYSPRYPKQQVIKSSGRNFT